MNVDLTEEQRAFVASEVASGKFASASEVVAAALDGWRDAKLLAWMRAAIDEGDESGVYEGDAFADVRRELGLPTR